MTNAQAKAGFGLGKIGQIAMPVQDLRRAVTFYRETLGVKFLFEAPPALAFFDCDGVRLMLDKPEDKEFERHGSILYFRVPDINAAYEALGARGIAFEGAPHIIHKTPDYELWMCFFRDTERNMLALMAEITIPRGAKP
jgi:methylmalonyl-CoA/ethylmalonyl-CoA epimerase